jgi:hypothetical protein
MPFGADIGKEGMSGASSGRRPAEAKEKYRLEATELEQDLATAHLLPTATFEGKENLVPKIRFGEHHVRTWCRSERVIGPRSNSWEVPYLCVRYS